jgi:asparagine synthase (glutamine-hydrolysing)
MCGIVGVYNLQNDPTPPTDGLAAAMDRMALRGPDGEGTFEGLGVALGHRRLAVIDIEGGPQPWVDTETGVVLVFNGELYNHDALRDELSAKSHPFRSRSDTEVLCRAFVEWGVECVDRLVGMFAFAVWDPREAGVFLARDRLGVKPLYWSMTADRFSFASSVSALRALPGVSGRLDPHAVSHYLTTVRTTMGECTLLQDVKTLEPGHAMWVRRDRPLKRWRYWEIPVYGPGEKDECTLDSASQQLRELLEASVRDRLIADVPVGSFLSGGIDSAVVAAVAGPEVSEPLTTYSVGFERQGYNEWPYVRETAKHLGVRNVEILLSEEGYTDYWAGLMLEKGLPLSTPNEVGIYHLSSALRQECVVALTGEGADEVLGGYTVPYFSALDYDRAMGGANASLSESLKRLYGRDRFDSRLEHFFLLNSWMPSASKWALLEGDVASELSRDNQICSHYRDLLTRFGDCSTMDAYLQVHARINLEGLLSRVDSSTMAASVEARVPFTDHRLVEFAFGMPDHLKLDWMDPGARSLGADLNIMEINGRGLIDSKRMLRRAFGADLPQSVVQRPKMSFPTPFVEAFRGALQETVEAVFEESPLVGTLFDREAVGALVGTGNIAVWPVANLCLWSLVGDGVHV